MTATLEESIVAAGEISNIGRAYAFLSASYLTPLNGETIKGPVDLLNPMVGAVLSKFVGQQIKYDKIQEEMKARFFVSVPLYLISKVVARFEKKGVVKFIPKLQNIAMVVKSDALLKYEDHLNSVNIPNMDALERDIELFANKNFQNSAPKSAPTWVEVLIEFFGFHHNRERRFMKKNDQIVLASPADDYVVARYMEESALSKSPHLETLQTIFAGVLIDDFLSTIQDIGERDRFDHVTVFYDTPILMRILGASGRLAQQANLEMHNLLQSMGAKTEFFKSNITEVERIIDAILGAHDSGYEIQGETAEAISLGEYSIGDLRLLRDSFEGNLAENGIYPTRHSYQSLGYLTKHQIDERGLAAALIGRANFEGKGYKDTNAQVDAQSTAMIMLLRRGRQVRALSDVGFLFVTSNSLLARVSREFLVEGRAIDRSSIPPVVTVPQMTTALWLAASNKIEPHKISSRLVASYTSALRPKAEWLAELVKRMKSYQERGADAGAEQLLLKTPVMRALQDESMNEPRLVETMSLERIVAAAENYEKQLIDQKEAEWVSKQAELEGELRDQHTLLMQQAIERTKLEAAQQLAQENAMRRSRILARARAEASRQVFLAKAITAAAIVGLTVAGWFVVDWEIFLQVLVYVGLFIVALLSTAGLVGFIDSKGPWDALEAWLRNRAEKKLLAIVDSHG